MESWELRSMLLPLQDSLLVLLTFYCFCLTGTIETKYIQTLVGKTKYNYFPKCAGHHLTENIFGLSSFTK